MADPYRAISDPTRRRILDLTREQDLSVGELAAKLRVSQPAVSQQLKVLKEAKLISFYRSGRQKLFYADAAALSVVADWLAHYDQFWESRLEKLGAQLAKKRN